MSKAFISQTRTFFCDSLSQQIFDFRINCGTDTRRNAFPETLAFTELKQEKKERLLHFYQELQNQARPKFIFGAGGGCSYILSGNFFNIIWQGIIDNKATGTRYGLPIISFDEFIEKYPNAVVFNSVGLPAGNEIQRQCDAVGIYCVSLFEFDISCNQYFDLPHQLGLMRDDEVFVHAGCYNGDTQLRYIRRFGKNYRKMITFEPSEEQFFQCRKKIQGGGGSEIELIQAGLSDHNGIERFAENTIWSCISEQGDEEVKVVALDEYMHGQNVTFIALDIEGGELAALRGAEHIIKTQKPKLAISIYHKPEDMWEIPMLIKRYCPDYTLYLRHYSLLTMGDTILYALKKQ